MSVKIVESEMKQAGQGWQVSRRAFLAQTSALLVAMGIPAKQAAAMAGQLYQTKEQALAGSGLVDEIVMALSSKVTDAVDPSGAASVQLLVKKFYEEAGLSSADAQVALDNYLASKQTIGALGGETVADVLGNAIAPEVLGSIEAGIQQASAKMGSSPLASQLEKVLSGAVTSADLTAGAASGEPLYVFQDPEGALLSKMLAPLHESRTRIEALVPNGKVSVGLQESAAKLQGEVLNVVVANWLETQYDEADFTGARELAQAVLAKNIDLPATRKAADALMGVQGSQDAIVGAAFAKVRALVNDPTALHGALEGELAESQAELDEILAKLDSLSKELTGQPLQFAENTPGSRYVLADLNGIGDKVTEEMVSELNRLNDRAGELSVKVVEMQFQMEDLNVQGTDGIAVEAKLRMLEHQVARAAETLGRVVASLHETEAVTTKTSTDEAIALVATAIEEAYSAVEMNKDLARADISPVDWAVEKSAAAQLLVQAAQMSVAMREGLQFNGGTTAMAETFKMLGRWNANFPLEGLESLCQAQLNVRTDAALQASSAFAKDVTARFAKNLAGMGREGWSKSVSNIVAAALSRTDAKLDTPVSELGLGANATVAEVVAALNGAVPSSVELKSIQEDVYVAAVSAAFGDALLASAKDNAITAVAFSETSTAEVAATNVHVLGYQVLAAFAADPVAGAIANYLSTMVAGAFSEAPVSLAAYADVDAKMVDTIVAKSQARQLVVASAKEPLSESGNGLIGLLLPNLLSGFTTFSRDIIVRQAKSTLKIEIQ